MQAKEWPPPFEGGYTTIDTNWRITSCNAVAATILGCDEKWLAGKDIRDIFARDSRFLQLVNHLKNLTESPQACRSGNSNLTTTIAGDNGSPMYVQVLTLPAADGTWLGAALYFSDPDSTIAAGRLALDSIAEGVFTVDHQKKITFFNQAAERITGWQETEVVGLPCSTVFSTPLCDDACLMSRAIDKGDRLCKRTVFVTTKNGRSIPVLISATPLFDLDNNIIGGVETFRDITATLQNEIILDAVADGVFTVDERGHITSFNRAAEEITGWLEEEVLGKSCAEILFGSSNITSCPLAICMHEKKNLVDYELFIIGKDG
ncbi:MAG: PAS domain-containing protein [Desulfopila sp.]